MKRGKITSSLRIVDVKLLCRKRGHPGKVEEVLTGESLHSRKLSTPAANLQRGS